MDFMAEMPDPLEPLRAQGAPDEIVRSLAEVMIIDELVGSGRAARVTQFKLGASVGGLRKLELEWEPRRRYVNERGLYTKVAKRLDTPLLSCKIEA